MPDRIARLETEINTNLARINELIHGDPHSTTHNDATATPLRRWTPPELAALLHRADPHAWHTGWVPIGHRDMLIAVRGPRTPFDTTAIYTHLQHARDTRDTPGPNIGPIRPRPLPTPLAGYVVDDTGANPAVIIDTDQPAAGAVSAIRTAWRTTRRKRLLRATRQTPAPAPRPKHQ